MAHDESMAEIHVRLQGVTPLLVHAISNDDLTDKRATSRGDQDPAKEAERFLYKDAKGNPVIPSTNLLRCLMDAGVHIKQGKRGLSTTKSSQVPGLIYMTTIDIPIQSKEGWEVDIRAVSVGNGKILRARPRFDDWILEFDIRIREKVLTTDIARTLFDIAGTRIGLGDFRPHRMGPFGQFRVDHWSKGKHSARLG